MIAVAAVAMAGVRVEVPHTLREVLFVLLGSSIGTGISPELLAGLGDWPLSLAGLLVSVAAVQLGCQWFLTGVCGWERQTAFFAAVPGVTSYVVVLALPTGANTAQVAISQTVRVFLLVALTPSLLSAIEPVTSLPAMPTGPVPELLLTLAAGTAGGLAFRYVGVPAGAMIGAMIASGALHGAGVIDGAFPTGIQIAVFIGLGAVVGSRFADVSLASLRSALSASFGSFVVAVAIAGAAAWAVAAVTGMPFGQVALAFAPGGLDVMAAMAFALQYDTAFVAAHQIARFLSITVYAPIFGRPRRRRPTDETRKSE